VEYADVVDVQRIGAICCKGTTLKARVGNRPPRVLETMRVVPLLAGERFLYSLEVKRDWKNTVDYECPPRLDASVLKNLEKSAINAFQVLGCRDFARVDYRIGNDGTPYFLEINPLPGLGDYSDLVIMAQKMGWTYDALIGAVLSAALGRYPLCGQQSSTTSQ
jgi:D-alanine-D-alanine ligase